jgi:prepilin-type N-terminal cleavage/methylation domain-containing protein
MRHPFASLRRRAFSLLELSVVLAILGVLAAGGLTVGSVIVEQQTNRATNDKLDVLEQALIDFVKDQNRLPCVAPLNVLPASGAFGTELAAGGCLAATPTGTGTGRAVSGTNIVRFGAVPTRTLGLKDSAASDEFGNRFLYAVTEAHTTTAGFTATPVINGQITVQGSAATVTNNASFILLSHGPDGKGAARYQTNTTPTACGTSTNLDVENCNAPLNDPTTTDVTFRDARFNNGSQPSSFFDDFTRFMPRPRLVAAAAGVALWSNSGDNIYSVGNDNNTATGNVGIGVTNPPSRLTVLGNGTGIAQLGVVGCGGNYAGMALGQTVAATCANYNILSSPTDPNLYINRPTGASIRFRENNTDQMAIDSGGNVGIGTGGPWSRLHVLNSATAGNTTPQAGTTQTIQSGTNNYLSFINTADNDSNAGMVMTDNNTGGYVVFKNFSGGATSDSMLYGAYNDHVFQVGASDTIGGKTEVMRIRQSGNVGIGTTAPGAKLDVGEAGASQCCATQVPNISLAQPSNTNGRMSWLQFHNGGESEAYIRLAGGGTGIRAGQRRLEIGDSQGNFTSLTVPGTGNIGIGTTDPLARLHVNGTSQTNAIITNNAGGYLVDWPGGWSGGLAVQDIVGSATYMSFNIIRSDRRYKKDIAPLAAEEMLSGVMKLKPVSYHYKDPNQSQNLNYGLIAQDVRDVFPNLITGKETKKDRLGLNYDGFIAPLIASVQLLKHENDALKARLDALDPAHANAPPAATGAAPVAPIPQALIVLLSLFVGAGTAYFALRRRSA